MQTSKKKLGILGLGARSTAFFISKLHRNYHESKGNYHTFPYINYNIDFNTINPYLPNNFEKLLPELNQILRTLESLPIHSCLIPNITLHEAFDKLKFDLPLIHPMPLTIAYLKDHHIKRVVLFGSKYSMTSNYITSKLDKAGIISIKPTDNHINIIDKLRQKIYNETETLEDIEAYKKLIEAYATKYFILVCCTELSMVSAQIKSKDSIIDMGLLQIEKALTQ